MLTKKIYNRQNFLEEFGFEIEDNEYFLFKTSGSEGKQKNILVKKNIFIENLKLYVEKLGISANQKVLITSKASVEHPYAFGLSLVIDNLIFYENIKDKINEMTDADVIFSTPSFFINFKDFIKINKKQKIVFTGEEIPSQLKEELIDFDIYQSFGMTECLNVGIKKLQDEGYRFLNSEMKIKDNYFYSPYLSSYVLEENNLKKIEEKYLLTDSIRTEDDCFYFLERGNDFAKINEEKISLKAINDFLFSIKEIKDLVVFKNKKNDFDQINLFYVSYLNKKEIEDLIIKHFNNINYVPQKIYNVDYIPITNLGKKDISKLKNDYP